MKIISWDIGIINLAYCIMDYQIENDVEKINMMADGAVVGSALISRINKGINASIELEQYVRELKGIL